MTPGARKFDSVGLPAVESFRASPQRSRIVVDLTAVMWGAAVALVVGLSFNALRPGRLPWVYQTREHRLQAAVARVAVDRGKVIVPDDPASLPHEIRLDEFQAFVNERRGIVLDARPAIFFAQGHVPTALNLPRETFEVDYARLKEVLEARKGQEIAIYCSGADCPDSQLLADALTRLGHRRLLIYTSGWDEWSQSGLPQEAPPS